TPGRPRRMRSSGSRMTEGSQADHPRERAIVIRVKTGLDVWVEQGFSALKGRRVGAIVNPTSVDSRFRHLADLLVKTPGVTLAALFGPEHGIRGEAQYMVAV